jgi:hypothetical protein
MYQEDEKCILYVKIPEEKGPHTKHSWFAFRQYWVLILPPPSWLRPFVIFLSHFTEKLE